MIKTLFISIILWSAYHQHAVADYTVTNISKGVFLVSDENKQAVAKLHGLSFKPRWQWMGVEENAITESKHTTTYSYLMDNGNIQWKLAMQAQTSTPTNNTLAITSELSANKTIPLTYIALALSPDKSMNNGRAIITDTAGVKTELNIPLRVKNMSNVRKIQFVHADKTLHFSMSFTSPVDLHIDRSVRIKLVDKEITAENNTVHTATISTPQPLTFYSHAAQLPNDTNHASWFAFTPTSTAEAGAIGMQDWLSPSDDIAVIDGATIHQNHRAQKVWGTNVEYIDVAPTQKNADKRTRFFAKYGINSVRLHKLTNSSWEGLGNDLSASQYDEKKLSRFDYWLHTLKDHGISYGFSPIWDLRVFDGDKDKLLAYDELVKAKPQKPVTLGLVWFAEDIQNLHIETMVNLLDHKNPHTGLRYANDPALLYFEIQNEENVFFYTFMSHVKKYPSYHKLLAEQFSDWLITKYQTHEQLVNTWGRSAINTFKNEGGLPDEHLDQRNITPVTSPWFHDNQATTGRRAKRLQDTAEFLFDKQNAYYQKAVNAIRATGYNGMIVSSNWQAGHKGAHFLNLLSDADIGIIDRHNYQGGAKGTPGHVMRSGFTNNNQSMLGNPGSGLLSTGMQQVSDRPFMFSEWLSVVPAEAAAADTALVAIYGFGLQGWDASYHFASNGNGFSPQLTYPQDKKFNNLTPVGVGLYPVLSRMVLRGDITEAQTIATRRLNQQQAITNQYDFENTVEQQHDVKSLSGTPSHNALAAGKILAEFTEEPGVSDISDWEKHYLKKNADGSSTITSNTQELKWTYTHDKKSGFVEVNSKGTQGIIGFTKNTRYDFDDVSITPLSDYSVILATAKSPLGTLQSDKEAIIVAIARAHNTNMNIDGSLIANAGEAPIILEPVKATLTFKRKGTIEILDHDGLPTGKKYPIGTQDFLLDTQRDKTIYYRVSFDSE